MVSKTEMPWLAAFVVVKSILGIYFRIWFTISSSSIRIAVDSVSTDVTLHPFLDFLVSGAVFRGHHMRDQPVIRDRIADWAQTVVRKCMVVVTLPRCLEGFFHGLGPAGIWARDRPFPEVW